MWLPFPDFFGFALDLVAHALDRERRGAAVPHPFDYTIPVDCG
jgi:hypothetical protein